MCMFDGDEKESLMINTRIKEAAAAEALKWNAMMDALEANWLVKMANTRDEYKCEHVAVCKARLQPLQALIKKV